MEKLKKWFETELDRQHKIVVVMLIATAGIALIMLLGFIAPTIFQGLRSIFTGRNSEWIYGNASDYLPGVGELPPGFRLVEAESGPIELDYANFYRSTYINPEQEQQQREVKVLYSAGIYETVEIATDSYQNFSDPDYYPGYTINKVFPMADFTNVDSVAMLLSNDVDAAGSPFIAYTLVFRYRNFTATVTTNAPVRDFNDEYATQMQSRLMKAVVYYASLVIDKLPVDKVANVYQPPFGEFTISDRSIIVEPTRGLLLESTYTPGP